MSQRITVEGMSCTHCEQRVVSALESVSGVTSASADNEANTAIVDGEADPDALSSAVAEAGYDASI